MSSSRSTAKKTNHVYDFVREKILQKKWDLNHLIPTEEELATDLKCSRGTVGRALMRLVQEGFIERRTSAGTRVIYDSSKTPNTPLELNAYAFVHPSKQHEGTWRTLRGFQDAAAMVDCRTVMLSTGMDFRKEAEIIGRLDEFSVKGAVLFPVILNPKDMAYYAQTILNCRLPIVLATMNIPAMQRPAVVADNFHAGYTMTRYLIDQGIQKIGFIDNYIWARRERYLGYRQAMEEDHIFHSEYVQIDSTSLPDFDNPINQPFEIAKNYLLKHPHLEGVVGADDNLGIGLIHAALSLNISIPDSLKIVGINNYSFSDSGAIGLTTYSVDYEKIGRISFKLLQETILNGKNTSNEIQVRGEIIRRQSA